MSQTTLETGSKILNHQFVDESFSESVSADCDLYLVQEDSRWVHCAFHQKKNKFLLLKSYNKEGRKIYDYEKELNRLKESSPELKFKYRQVVYMDGGHRISLIPQPLYREDSLAGFFSLNHKLLPSEKLHADPVKKIEAYLLYSLPGQMQRDLEKHFPEVKIRYAVTAFLEGINIQYKSDEGPTVFIDVDDEHMKIAVQDKSKLSFCNIFEYKTDEDLLYYLLFVSEQLELNPDKTDYYFSGYLFKNSELFRLIWKYFRNTWFMKRLDVFNYTHHFQEVPEQQYYNLSALPLCEL